MEKLSQMPNIGPALEGTAYACGRRHAGAANQNRKPGGMVQNQTN